MNNPGLFPFADEIDIDGSLRISADEVLAKVACLLTDERRKKIERVVALRTFTVSVVLEDIYDRGNASAVMRSAEALGLTRMDVIEKGEKFKESQRASAGADKWIELSRWPSTSACIQELKSQGRQIVVTHLSANSRPIAELDFTQPTALVLGNEKDGASAEMIAAADHCVILPMAGFVQSYNISVAGALCFYHIYMDRLRRQGFHGDLTVLQKNILKAHYYLRTQPSARDMLGEWALRKEIGHGQKSTK